MVKYCIIFGIYSIGNTKPDKSAAGSIPMTLTYCTAICCWRDVTEMNRPIARQSKIKMNVAAKSTRCEPANGTRKIRRVAKYVIRNVIKLNTMYGPTLPSKISLG